MNKDHTESFLYCRLTTRELLELAVRVELETGGRDNMSRAVEALYDDLLDALKLRLEKGPQPEGPAIKRMFAVAEAYTDA